MKNYESLRVPKYVQLMLRLREQIENGVLKHGDPLPTREKLMKEYDLSLSTVTRAISELERQGWLISRQGSGTFVVKKAENETDGETPTIGLLVPYSRTDIQHFTTEFAHEASEQNLHVITMFASDDEEFELKQGRILLEKGVNSVVWFPVQPKKHVSVASLFRKNQIPVVICEKVTDAFESPWICVRSDYYGGAMSALQYFADQGHQRIAYIGPKKTESDFGPINERWNAYKDFMKEKGWWNPDELVFPSSIFKEWPVHVKRLEHQFQSSKAPTAIVAFDDTIALEAVRGLQSIGIRIPENVAVIGHGDYNQGHYCNPRLSTVSNCWSEYVDALLRVLRVEIEAAANNGAPSEQREIVVSQRLLIRESTAQSSDEVAAVR
ncbi:MAG: GntR family transcriptional regulator [Candidatus Omnitrophica bacterium]|nr:GntR family transcriptional regulator [Candidatus Omnitrophota bacterium]